MGRALARIGVVLMTVASEAVLVFLSVVFGWMITHQGRDALAPVGIGVLLQMAILLVGGLACVVASPASLRLASVLGRVLLVLGAVLAAVAYVALPNDANNGIYYFLVMLPTAVVFAGVWLMRTTMFLGGEGGTTSG